MDKSKQWFLPDTVNQSHSGRQKQPGQSLAGGPGCCAVRAGESSPNFATPGNKITSEEEEGFVAKQQAPSVLMQP